MAYGKIIICRADEAAETAKTQGVAAVLSIEHPAALDGKGRAPRLDAPPAQRILCFWDSEQQVEDGPDLEQVEQGLAFVMEHLARGDVIIHCAAGVARSTALALGALSLLYPHENEAALVQKLLEIRPIAAPNILVVGFVDELTGRGGRLLKAVQDHAGIAQRRRDAEESRLRWLDKNPEKGPKP